MFCAFFNKQTNKAATITTELLNKKLMRKNYKWSCKIRRTRERIGSYFCN